MTEHEWLAFDDPSLVPYELVKQLPDRKLWLYGAACCYTMWDDLDAIARDAVRLVGAVADGRFGYADGDHDYDECQRVVRVLQDRLGPSSDVTADSVVIWALDLGYVAAQKVGMCASNASMVSGRPSQLYADLLRCVVGNPFRADVIEPPWISSRVAAIASDIYDERAFEHLPILVDALLEAGCTSQPILAHLRSPGPHDRGCWVIDRIRGTHDTGRFISRSPAA